MSLIYMGYAKQDETTQKYMLSYKIVSMAGKILERTDILQDVYKRQRQILLEKRRERDLWQVILM